MDQFLQDDIRGVLQCPQLTDLDVLGYEDVGQPYQVEPPQLTDL